MDGFITLMENYGVVQMLQISVVMPFLNFINPYLGDIQAHFGKQTKQLKPRRAS
jgi:hypothetical protein